MIEDSVRVTLVLELKLLTTLLLRQTIQNLLSLLSEKQTILYSALYYYYNFYFIF